MKLLFPDPLFRSPTTVRSGLPILRLCPEPWIGLAAPYDKDWFEKVFKTAVATRAFDPLSKTWWFMRSYEPVVSQAVREKKWVHDSVLDACRAQLYRGNVSGPANPFMGPGGENGLGAEAAQEQRRRDYATLNLTPDAPPQLVDWALAFWRQQYAAIGAPPTKLMQAEEAYARIVAATGVAPR